MRLREVPFNRSERPPEGKEWMYPSSWLAPPITMEQAVRCLGILGRAALVGLTAESISLLPYTELINKEAEIIRVSDHLAAELPSLMEFARDGKLRFPKGTLRFVDLNAGQINSSLNAVVNSTDHIRTVIVPELHNRKALRADSI